MINLSWEIIITNVINVYQYEKNVRFLENYYSTQTISMKLNVF